MGEKHAEFSLLKDFESVPSTYSYYRCDAIDLDEPAHFIDMPQNDPSSVNCALLEGQVLDHVKVKYLPPSIVMGEPYAIDEGDLNDLCRFISLMMFMPPMH